MSASEIPDELWRKILDIGVKTSIFSYKDLCCISISCRRLCRLSTEDTLWLHLLSSDFSELNDASSSSSSSSPAKWLYRTRFEREKERKVAAYRRALLRKESEIAELYRRIRETETQLSEEVQRLHAATAEFSNLEKIRQASLALNVWQPEIVRSRQRQIVEQNPVPVKGRLDALEMEMKLCKNQIIGLNKSLKKVKRRLDTAKEELESMKYHPLRDYKSTPSGDQERMVKRKKLKTCIDFPEKPRKTL
ncbi:PREDICTED: F-box protein SKIP24 [Tarenaya hassleriana]|uniref:F-box protein SKIP24 n=1 Tax=Tarenaya hassleriana TaxID=28532 RepID=UPI00053C8BA7|nr:PREDICTED: F-box protein SKIP24 [Tarenaya hassleriana]